MAWSMDWTSWGSTGSSFLDSVSKGWQGVTDFFSTGFSWADVGKNVLNYSVGFAVSNAPQIASSLAGLLLDSDSSGGVDSGKSLAPAVSAGVSAKNIDWKDYYNIITALYWLPYQGV